MGALFAILTVSCASQVNQHVIHLVITTNGVFFPTMVVQYVVATDAFLSPSVKANVILMKIVEMPQMDALHVILAASSVFSLFPRAIGNALMILNAQVPQMDVFTVFVDIVLVTIRNVTGSALPIINA
jgi:hypothetical protein